MLNAKLAGASTAAIAAAAGLTRHWTGRELASGECRQIVLDLVAIHKDQIGRLFALSLAAIEEAFSARKIAVADHAPCDLGPDHYARLTAARRYLDVISLGRPTAAAASDKIKPRITLDQLEELVASRQAAVH